MASADALDRVAGVVLPELGDWLTIDLLDRRRVLRRRYTWGPEDLREVIAASPPEPIPHHALVFTTDVLGEPWEVVRVPLWAEAGTIGAASLGRARSRPSFEAADGALAEILGIRFGLSVESMRNRRLEIAAREELARHAGRLEALRAFALAVGQSLTLGELWAVLAEHGRRVLGADRVAVVVPSRRRGWLELVDNPSIPEGVRTYLARVPVSDPLPFTAAFRENRRIAARDVPSLFTEFPALRPHAAHFDLHGGVIIDPLRSGDRVVGVIAFMCREPRDFSAEELELVDALSIHVASVLERVLVHHRARDDAARQRFLARASELLASSLETDPTLATIADLAVPTFADWAAVDRFEGDRCRRIASKDPNPGEAGLTHRLLEQWRCTPEMVRRWRRSSTPILLPPLDEPEAGRAPDGEFELLLELGVRSAVLVPLRSRGEVVGRITFVYATSDRTYDETDLELALDLARRAEIALENSRLYEDVRAAEQARGEAERLFQRIADATPDILIVIEVPSARVLYVNREVQAVLGYSPEELLALASLEEAAMFPQDELPTLQAQIADVAGLPDGVLNERGYRVLHADGSSRWLQVRGVVFGRDERGVPTQVLGLARDATRERDAAEALKKSEERFRLATEAVRGLVYEWDVAAGQVLYSRGLVELVGYEPHEVSSDVSWWTARIHPDHLQAAQASLAQAAERGEARVELEYRFRHRSGRWRWVRDSAVLVRDAEGRLVRTVGCALDVTERIEAQEALREADRRKGDFLALLSHELRNPLAAMRHATEVMSVGSPEVVSRARQVTVRQIGHMARLLDDLLDVSRITSGKLTLREEPVELGALVRAVTEDQAANVEQAGIEARLELSDEPIWVDGDRTRLAQVVGNLLNNALKYTDRGGWIRVSVHGNPFEARIEVADSGVGIEPELMSKLFEPFWQGDRVRERSRGGFGLGLALVRGLAELHRGRVEVHSGGAGQGALFRVTLPRREAPAPIEPRVTQERGARRILVVEDNPDAAEMLGLMLRYAGHEVELAGDADTAIALARELRPDVVLCDIGLPGERSGHDVARALRADAECPLLIAVTGYGQAEDQRRALTAGFDHHLTKPIDVDVLEELIAHGPARARA